MLIRILIADDHAVFRAGLRGLLDKEADFVVVGEASSFAEIGARIDACSPDVLIIDLSMPGPGSAQDTVEAMGEAYPKVKVVVLTMHEDDYYLRQMFRVGAQAFVLKKSDASQLIAAVRAVHGGAKYVDPAMGSQLVDAFLSPQAVPNNGRLARLTPREQEVCRLLALGHTNLEIGALLTVSERTIEAHRSSIMGKLSLKSRAELVRFAIEGGLMKLE